MPYGIPKDIGGDSPENIEWMENCVEKVEPKMKGRKDPKGSAIAICKTALMKSKGKNKEASTLINLVFDLPFDDKE
jgi:hypothetical protein